MGSNWDSAYCNVSHTFSKEVGEFVYFDSTETSDMVFFDVEVYNGIRALESLANTTALNSEIDRRRTDMPKSETMTKFHAKLSESMPFSNGDGELMVVEAGSVASVVGGHYCHDAGEPVLHLEYQSSEGVVVQSHSPYSKIIPVLS